MSAAAPKWAYYVAYDLKQPQTQYAPLFEELKSSITWWHYLDSVWIVVRQDTLPDFASKLRPKIYQSDRLLITPAKGPAEGWLPKDAWEWINATLKSEW